MTGPKLIVPVLAAIASATVAVGLAAATHAAPIGPCAEVPYVGVCVPASEQPAPPQQSHADVSIPDANNGFQAVN